MAINKISATTIQKLRDKSVEKLPTVVKNVTPTDLKKKFTGIVVDDKDSIVEEINRIVDETNELVLTLKNDVGMSLLDIKGDIENGIIIPLKAKQDEEGNNIIQFYARKTDIEMHEQNTNNPHSVTKEQVGLSNVDNTADIDKPISNATQIALSILDNKKLDKSLKGASGGVAELDENGKVLTNQLPSYVDDILTFDSLTSFPATGENSKIYAAKDTNKIYRWGGTSYVEISASLALGVTSSTAYRGDHGKIAYDHSQETGNPHNTKFSELKDKPTTIAGFGITDAVVKVEGKGLSTYDYDDVEKGKLNNATSHIADNNNPHNVTKEQIGLGNVDNTSDADKPISTAQQTKFDLIDTQISSLSHNKADKTALQALASGSPKGVFPTLAALQAAYPTGDNSIYVVTADGHWYYWNGTAWADGGVYLSAAADSAMSETSTNSVQNQVITKYVKSLRGDYVDIDRVDDLFSPNTNIGTNGTYIINSSIPTNAFGKDLYIKIPDGETVFWFFAQSTVFIRFYDADFNCLGNGGQASATSGSVNVLASSNVNLTADAKYVKFGGNASVYASLDDFRAKIETNGVFCHNGLLLKDLIIKGTLCKTIEQSDMTSGVMISSEGVKSSNVNYYSIEKVPVLPGQVLYIYARFGGLAGTDVPSGGIAGYDKHGSYLKRVFDTQIGGYETNYIHNYWGVKVVVPEDVYFISFSGRPDASLKLRLQIYNETTDDNLKDGISYYIDGNRIFDQEIQECVESYETVLRQSGKPMLTLAVFTDLHNDNRRVVNPMWDMFANIKKLDEFIHFDGVYNLGDSIDGQFQTRYQAEEKLAQVTKLGLETTPNRYHCLEGNHDDNVQSTWSGQGGLSADNELSRLELYNIIQKGSVNEVHSSVIFTDFYVDYPEYDIRVICLGIEYTIFLTNTNLWLKNIALNTDKKVLVFAHCATKAEWGFNNDIVGGAMIEETLNEFITNGGTVIAYIHGHTHGDMIETDDSILFTEVAIGCAKFEKMNSGTQGMTYQDRSVDDATELLFDIVCVDVTNRKVKFIRFGAGQDREITY